MEELEESFEHRGAELQKELHPRSKQLLTSPWGCLCVKPYCILVNTKALLETDKPRRIQECIRKDFGTAA